MNQVLFEICCIGKNEVKTIPKLNDSLREYKERGGVINYLDTGSRDGTQELARSFGWNVKEVGEKYLVEVKNYMGINQRFIVEGEQKILKHGDKYFNFSAARNDCASMATKDVIFWYDCDEAATVLDIDFINKKIVEGFTQFDYWFVFAFDQFGGEAVKFIQCKAYDRRVMEWRGKVHELVTAIDSSVPPNLAHLPEDKYKLSHYQNHEQGRHSYLVGLAVDCFEDPHNDRHSHYLARELFWAQRPKSALKEFKRHITLHNGQGWHSERAESMIYIGDILGSLNKHDEQAAAYSQAYHTDTARNKALIKLAFYYRHHNNMQAAVCYAKAALEIPFGGFYAEDAAFYNHIPHEILYSCYGRMPNIVGYVEKAKDHLLKALSFQPYNPQYLHDTRFYFDYPDQQHIQGWMRFPELQFLYEQAKSGKYKNMFECGSWKGKSTHALLSGLKNVEGATLTCVDTWKGSQDERDDTHHMAKVENVFEVFQKNTEGFTNLQTIRKASVEAARDVPDGSIDWCFIDMGHTYIDVMNDLAAWVPKIKPDGIICGHDYTEGTWQEVVQAVNKVFGKPDYVVDSIWVVDMSNKFISGVGYEGESIDGVERTRNNCISVQSRKLLIDSLENYNEGQTIKFKMSPEDVPVSINKQPLIYKIEGKEAGEITRGEVIDLKDTVQGMISEKGILKDGKPLDNPEIKFEEVGYFNGEVHITKIPKRVFTVWLGDDMPELIQNCIASQSRMCVQYGYDFRLITLDNVYSESLYMQQALHSAHPAGVKYCKATDYLRWHYLYNEGGIFLDADIMIQEGKNFDEALKNKMFIGLEMDDRGNSGKVVLGTAVIGSVPRHPFLMWMLNEVESKFRGDDNKNYESSMELLNIGGVAFQDQLTLYAPDYFHAKDSATGEVKITDRTICVHHFSKLWTPETNAPKSTLQQFKYNIENNINLTFVKRGDGEVACMNGEVGANCDNHPYSKELGDKLRESYEYLESVGAHIVDFDDQKNYNVLLHRTDNNLQELSDFYKAIRDSNRPKILVGPDKLHKWSIYLNAVHISVPEVNAFSEINEIEVKILSATKEDWPQPTVNPIIIFCAGMPAKVMIREIHPVVPNATYLDCGSAFDPACYQSRTFQITTEQFWDLYKEPTRLEFAHTADGKVIYPEDKKGMSPKDALLSMLTEEKKVESKLEGKPGQVLKEINGEWVWVDPPSNNFNIPQEIHPEKIWAMENIIGNVKLFYDLGCGLNKTHECAVGMDIRPVTDIQGSIDDLSFEQDSAVDGIISRHSLEHLLDPVKALKEWTRVLKPGGKMVIVLPDHEYINTIDPYYSNGEHLHAYTRDSFKNLLSLFPELAVHKTETVMENWSFGTVIYKLPKVSIIIPQLGREDGLKKCKESIAALNYPRHLIELKIVEGEETVPNKVAQVLPGCTGEYYCYAANDMYFHPDALRIAIVDSLVLGKGLVSFNEGDLLPDKGNQCTHFVISKELVAKLENGEIFCTEFTHAGVDNYLVAQAEKLNQFHYCKDARIVHNHFSKGGEMDAVYEKGWRNVERDRETLKRKLLNLENDAPIP